MAKLGFAFGAVVCVMMFLQKGEGTQFIVGGAKGWSVSMAQTYNQWAEANRFQIGDSLGMCVQISYFYSKRYNHVQNSIIPVSFNN